MNKERMGHKIEIHHSRQTWKVCSLNLSGQKQNRIRLRIHGCMFMSGNSCTVHEEQWAGYMEGRAGGSDLTTTCVMLLVTLLMSSSRPRSPCVFRTALYLPRGCWFPAVP